MGDGGFHAATQFDRAGTRCCVAQALFDHGLCEHGCRGGSIAGFVLGLGRHLLDQLGPDVFKGVFQFDFLGDRVAVINDVGRSE